MSTTSVQKRAAHISNVEESRGAEIKSVRNNQDVCSKSKVGRPTYLTSYEEALVVASSGIEGAHGVPIVVNTLASKFQLVVKAVNARKSTKDITENLSCKYTR